MSPLTEYAGNRRRPRRGFTLTELLVTTTLVGLVLAGALPFLITNLKILFVGEQKLLINSDIRTYTSDLVENARESNYFVLYQSFHAWTRADGRTVTRDASGNGTVNANDRRQSGEQGDFLVFVYYNDPYYDSRFYDNIAGNEPVITGLEVSRVVAYWHAPNNRLAGENTVYSFDTDDYKGAGATWNTPWGITLPATLDSAVTIESLLPPATSAWATDSRFKLLVKDVGGLTADGYQYENFQNRSILVRLRILHGNQAKRVTNTYNFTITPRG
ncbi:MAG: prepilin-type N-terminal cleavage/methylation domain-containing protein [Verrucomicrobiota bacterium]